LLGVLLLHQQSLDQFAGGRSNRRGPVHQPPGRPLGMGPMRRRHVVGDGGVAAFAGILRMTGDPATFGQHFDGAAGDAQFDFLAHQGMRHAVIVAVVLDVVIDIDAGTLPFGQHEPRRWQRPEVGCIQLREGVRPASWQFLEWAKVECR